MVGRDRGQRGDDGRGGWGELPRRERCNLGDAVVRVGQEREEVGSHASHRRRRDEGQSASSDGGVGVGQACTDVVRCRRSEADERGKSHRPNPGIIIRERCPRRSGVAGEARQYRGSPPPFVCLWTH